MRFDTETYRSFLLGRLADHDREELEARFIADPTVFDQIEAVETDLVDEWVRGELSPEDRLAMDRHRSSSPRLAERLDAASALAFRVDRPAARSSWVVRNRRAWRLAAGLAGLVILPWATLRTFDTQEEPTSQVAEVVLWGETLRGASEAELVTLRADHELLALQVDLGSSPPYPSYLLELRAPDGKTIWAPSPLVPMRLSWGMGLISEIPEALLADGIYRVELQGLRGEEWEPIAFYDLEVRRELVSQ